MCLRYIKYAPIIIFENPIICDILEFALNINVTHIDCAKALYLFLGYLFNHFRNKKVDQLNELEGKTFSYLLNKGPAITIKLIKHIESAPHYRISEYLVDCLIDLFESIPTYFTIWISEAIRGISSDCLIREEKVAFIKIVEAHDRKEFVEKLNEFVRRANNKAKRNR